MEETSENKSTTEGSDNNQNTENKLEKYKLKLNFIKWIVGTVGLTLIATIIKWGFDDRKQGISEVDFYNRYATELLVLNENPVKKRMLAQYFMNVIPSCKLKKGWQDYFIMVDSEYVFLKEEIGNKEKLYDKLDSILIVKKESKSLTKMEESRIERQLNKLKEEMAQYKEYYKDYRIPANSLTSPLSESLPSTHFVKNNNADIISAEKFEREGFELLLIKNVTRAINSFILSENSYNNYHQVYEIANLLKQRKPELLTKDPTVWKDLYALLLSKEYNFGLPDDIKKRLEAEVAKDKKIK